jgi:hypothetical protein
VVSEGETNIPVLGSRVTLHNAITAEEKAVCITDRAGRFGFTNPEPGEYYVLASHPLTSSVKSASFTLTREMPWPTGMRIEVTRIIKRPASGLISFLIKLLAVLEACRLPLLAIGSALAIVNAVLVADLLSYILVGVYAFFWIVEFILMRRGREYGLVKDSDASSLIQGAALSLYRLENGYRILVTSTLSNFQGKYRLFVTPGTYTLNVQHPEYLPGNQEIVTSKQTPESHTINLLKDTGQLIV